MDATQRNPDRRSLAILSSWIVGVGYLATAIALGVTQTGADMLGVSGWLTVPAALAAALPIAALLAAACAIDILLPIGKGNLEICLGIGRYVLRLLLRDDAWGLNVVVMFGCVGLVELACDAFR